MIKKVVFLWFGIFIFLCSVIAQKAIPLTSLSGSLNAVLSLENGSLKIEILKEGRSVMEIGSIGTNHKTISILDQISTNSSSLNFYNNFSTKNRDINLKYKRYLFNLGAKENLEVLVFEKIITYRFIFNSDEVEIQNESFQVNFGKNGNYYSTMDPDVVHSSSEYSYAKIDFFKDVPLGAQLGMPIVYESTLDKKYILLIAEANVDNFPLTYFKKDGKYTITAEQPMRVSETSRSNAPRSRVERVVSRASYAAKMERSKNQNICLPWRIFGVFDSDLDLIGNDIILALSEGRSSQQDYSWVKPGKAIWDWWSARGSILNGYKIGIDTKSYQLLSEFASKFSVKYLIIDGGWSKGISQKKYEYANGVDMVEVMKKAKNVGVGVFLWVLWKDMENAQQMTSLLNQLKSLGVAGIKLDFIDRSDVDVVKFYETVAKECAKRKLMVIFHGSYPPTGLERKYPNIITYEAVRGLEYNKWSKDISPNYNVTIPFTRMFLGNMDYTPGSFKNVVPSVFKQDRLAPYSQGTLTHNIAQYVVYESFIQTLSDRPSNYLQNLPGFQFILEIPTTWDKTIPLDGKIGDYLILARRNGENWYIGGMNGGKGRSIDIKLDFITNKSYNMKYIDDSGKIMVRKIRKDDIVNIDFGDFGGWCGILTPVK
ncbi:glycoside hydrolase family 97 catalytic domain-containing protein [Sphingobacterium sp. DR205]|uniref:glycoside hydrolase family 97 catalytic domain-containing protein n=1 Tax=Sphingobacterium sp. DR205 TaxID=2713573 RepID=UPI0013E50304|nr:glycoside hydrolase family 97 catalytic domain-containing protein [Sphingobacterium sp. DR205]QIH31571.1 glycoside hydrolase family 97 protein [Sphingobacterium sp. DR205]